MKLELTVDERSFIYGDRRSNLAATSPDAAWQLGKHHGAHPHSRRQQGAEQFHQDGQPHSLGCVHRRSPRVTVSTVA